MTPAEYYALYAHSAAKVNTWSYLNNPTYVASSAVTHYMSNWTQWSYASTCATSAATATWQLYDSVWGVGHVTIEKPQAPAVVSEETRRRFEAERAAHDEQLRQYTREKRAKEEESRKRARALLMQSLTRDQQRSLEERSYFDLNVGGKHYRIRQGTHGNVRLVQGEQETVSYCAQPDDVPAEDAMLAQKLMLETDEAAFLRVANARQLYAAR
jgi:hypothetical protein